MARQGRSGGGSRPSRPTVAPARPSVAPKQQTRPATTAAYPGNRAAAPPAAAAPGAAPAAAAPAGPGLFANMASTAAGVAVGSSIGHAIGGFFGGGSSAAPAEAEQSQMTQSQGSAEQSNWGARSCEVDAKQFTKCLDENQGNMQTCSWYLEQLKACQSAASGY
ncbi:hypothetical protein V501_08423 [Pseudogymnoascus sp. VKM F-4519 (FW-2642)]|uniref:CHCH domain-containing protein n=1 Tax=Pseudogymnoascus verrucosus TaxID=342668 RepID=A0A1B8GU25_9PEZI|nr:uncharacterized protein VE01_02583 [Pseudogymnoascus verrucosus]KFZ05360.1 hypothetical protein V501_08423 [Pseudogymnoascus sp. VKM F-4519 (FW-2642)]OBT99344.1 hypothetical protein VE01_02583 [Pseudogymnoascus verrucosus]